MDRHLTKDSPLKPSDFPEGALELFYEAVKRWERLAFLGDSNQILTECAMLFLLGTHLAEVADENTTKKARESKKPSFGDPSDQQIA